MKIEEIIQTVSRRKPISRRTCYNLFARLEILPVSKNRQHPQQYPDNAPKKILAFYGLELPPVSVPVRQVFKMPRKGERRVLSLGELKTKEGVK